MGRDSGYSIIGGGLHYRGRPVKIPKGFLYLALARAGWKGEDGPLLPEFVQRLRLIDPRLRVLYFPVDRESAA